MQKPAICNLQYLPTEFCVSVVEVHRCPKPISSLSSKNNASFHPVRNSPNTPTFKAPNSTNRSVNERLKILTDSGRILRQNCTGSLHGRRFWNGIHPLQSGSSMERRTSHTTASIGT